MRARFPASGEINFRVADAPAAIAAVEAALGPPRRASTGSTGSRSNSPTGG
jgi:hypothetical protein